jgi:hypothetical protein
LNNFPTKPKILFVYEDQRAEYLIDELKEQVDITGILRLEWRREFFFWVNLLLCGLKFLEIMIRKHTWTWVSFGILYHNITRRPAYIKKMSSKIEKYISAIKTGLLLKTRDPGFIAEQIRKLYQDKTIFLQMSNSAIQNYVENGTWRIASKKIKNGLELICSSEKRKLLEPLH